METELYMNDCLAVYDQFCKMYYNFKTRAWQKIMDWNCLAYSPEDLASKWHGYARDNDIVFKKVSSAWLAA